MPNGVAMNHTGVNFWKPKTAGMDFEFSPILKPLEPFRNQVTVVSGLHNRAAESLGDGNGDHTRSTGSWLTGTHIKRTEGSRSARGHFGRSGHRPRRPGKRNATAVARAGDSSQLGDRRLRHRLQLRLWDDAGVGVTDDPVAHAKQSAACLRTAVRRRRSCRTAARGGAHPRTASSIRRSQEMASLRTKLGPAGSPRRWSDYLDVLREVERRIQQTEAKNAHSPLPEYERPGIGVPEQFDDHAKLMFDLQCLASPGRRHPRHHVHVWGGNSAPACIRRSG